MKLVQFSELSTQFPDCNYIGKKDGHISKTISLDEGLSKDCSEYVGWINDKNSAVIQPGQLKFGLLILSESAYQNLKTAECNFFISPNPRSTFAKIISLYFHQSRIEKIEKTAQISDTSRIGKNCYIGHHVVIEENCTIGDNTTIMHNTVIMAGTKIGNHVRIGCNSTIGNYGFGYEKDDSGDYQLLEHLGKVVIHDNVEIHNNTCIDRGMLGITEIHENVKIDNLVHIAHGVVIERNALVIAHAMVGGSVRIGESAWIAPSVAIKNQIKIGKETMTGIGAVILKDTKEKSVMIGNPAITMEEHKKWSETRKKLS